MKSLNDDLMNEFLCRTEPIKLEAYEVCKYKDVCPFKNEGDKDIICKGISEDRDWVFICDIKELIKK
ncbi:MAG: hypothetical protein ACOCP4_00915 [Candidatus Woesearchaeota archaeon]